MNLLKKAFLFLSSYGFAVIILFFLLILTLLGTIYQIDHGLLAATQRYFESAYAIEYLFGVIPIPLPGVYLLMSLLFINVLFGALLRARKDWRRPGLLISHFGILMLIGYGFVTHHFSDRGHMRLYEGESSSRIQSYYDWELVITELEKGGKQYVIPPEVTNGLKSTGSGVFVDEGLPFEFHVKNFAENSSPTAAPNAPGAVDGILLQALDKDPQAEMNIAGAVVALVEPDGATQETVLWGVSQEPWVTDVAGKPYSIDLRHVRSPVPFTIVLDKFTRELHPRTGIASNFQSTVTQVKEGVGRQVEIKMNEPLRDSGFTFYQASWGPQNAGPNTRLFSVFEVTNNPAEQWPLWACYVITFGLLVHFCQKLFKYLRAEARRRAA
jgi:hypothetical protein